MPYVASNACAPFVELRSACYVENNIERLGTCRVRACELPCLYSHSLDQRLENEVDVHYKENYILNPLCRIYSD